MTTAQTPDTDARKQDKQPPPTNAESARSAIILILVIVLLGIGGLLISAVNQPERPRHDVRKAEFNDDGRWADVQLVLLEYGLDDPSAELGACVELARQAGSSDCTDFTVLQERIAKLPRLGTDSGSIGYHPPEVVTPEFSIQHGEAGCVFATLGDRRFRVEVRPHVLRTGAARVRFTLESSADPDEDSGGVDRKLRYETVFMANGRNTMLTDLGEIVPGSGRAVVIAMRAVPSGSVYHRY